MAAVTFKSVPSPMTTENVTNRTVKAPPKTGQNAAPGGISRPQLALRGTYVAQASNPRSSGCRDAASFPSCAPRGRARAAARAAPPFDVGLFPGLSAFPRLDCARPEPPVLQFWQTAGKDDPGGIRELRFKEDNPEATKTCCQGKARKTPLERGLPQRLVLDLPLLKTPTRQRGQPTTIRWSERRTTVQAFASAVISGSSRQRRKPLKRVSPRSWRRLCECSERAFRSTWGRFSCRSKPPHIQWRASDMRQMAAG